MKIQNKINKIILISIIILTLFVINAMATVQVISSNTNQSYNSSTSQTELTLNIPLNTNGTYNISIEAQGYGSQDIHTDVQLSKNGVPFGTVLTATSIGYSFLNWTISNQFNTTDVVKAIITTDWYICGDDG